MSYQSDGSTLDQVRKAYARLSHEQLLLFCTLRSIPIEGSVYELTARLANHDIQLYSFPPAHHGFPINGPHHTGYPLQRSRSVKAPDLPIEILAEIMDHLGDWELARAVGVPTSLPQPVSWSRASQSDHAILTGYIPLIRAADPPSKPPTHLGGIAAIRFGYVNVLEFFITNYRSLCRSLFKHDIIPKVASHHGRISVLEWWGNAREKYPDIFSKPSKFALAEAVDGASRNGQVASLDWWLHSGMPLEFTEAALELASAKNHLDVLSWWKTQSKIHKLHLKIGRVMDMASTAGHVEVLEWWHHSGLEPKYDKQAMYHASCHGKVRFFSCPVLLMLTLHDRLTFCSGG